MGNASSSDKSSTPVSPQRPQVSDESDSFLNPEQYAVLEDHIKHWTSTFHHYLAHRRSTPTTSLCTREFKFLMGIGNTLAAQYYIEAYLSKDIDLDVVMADRPDILKKVVVNRTNANVHQAHV